MNTVENIVKIRNPVKRNADLGKRNKEKAHLPYKFGPQTHKEAVKAQPEACHEKAVARRASQGAASPLLLPIKSNSRVAMPLRQRRVMLQGSPPNIPSKLPFRLV